MTVDVHGAVHATDTGRFTGHTLAEADAEQLLTPPISFLTPREMVVRRDLAIVNGFDPDDARFADLAAMASVEAARLDIILGEREDPQSKLDEAFALLLHDGTEELPRNVTMRLLAERVVPDDPDGAHAMAALASYDSRAAYEYAPTPVHDVHSIGTATSRHLGRGVWGTRCPECSHLFTTNGHVVYDRAVALHLASVHGKTLGPMLP